MDRDERFEKIDIDDLDDARQEVNRLASQLDSLALDAYAVRQLHRVIEAFDPVLPHITPIKVGARENAELYLVASSFEERDPRSDAYQGRRSFNEVISRYGAGKVAHVLRVLAAATHKLDAQLKAR